MSRHIIVINLTWAGCLIYRRVGAAFGFRAGLPYAVNTTLFSGFAFMPESLPTETLLKFLIINLIWILIHLLWLAAGNTAHQLNLRSRTQFLINCGMALAMLSVVALALISLV